MNNRHQLVAAGILAAAISLAAFAVVCHSGTILYYGDAVSHLNIGRRIVDSKTPGWAQIGTVWLPLPHLLTAMTVWWDPLWTSGAAGALPSIAAFIIGAVFLFRIARREFGTSSPAMAWAALGLYLLNLNLLYLQSTPMTEAPMMAALLAAVWYAGEGRSTPAGLWLMAGTLTRYDAWFYIPFIALYLWRKYDLRRAIAFGLIASIGPALWLVHNFALYGNALEWFNGPYSAKAIEARSASSGGAMHPGDHNLSVALLYYWKAVRLAVGNVPSWLAVAGSLCILWRKRRITPAMLLWLPMIFYTVSIAYGSVPIFVPQWWPFAFYNVRYALQVLPAIAVLAPAVLPGRTALLLVVFVAAGWILGVSKSRADAIVVYREAESNSIDRRYAIELLAKELSRGCNETWMGGGDWTGALIAADIPFRRVIHDGNRLAWKLASQHPEMLVDCVIAQQGDGVDQAIAKLPLFERSFHTALDFSAPGESRLRLWRKNK